MTLFRPTSPCLCRAFCRASAMLCPACVPTILRSPPAPCAAPQTKRDGPGRPKALGAPSPCSFLGRNPPQPAAQRPVGGWPSSRQARNTKPGRSNPRSSTRRAGILPRHEVLTGALALSGTLQPHRGQPAAQSFQCHVAALPGPRCAGCRLRIAGYEQSVKRT